MSIDPAKPIGIFIFTADHKGASGIDGDFAVNVSRNNFIAEMKKQYGDNFVFVDNPAGAKEFKIAAQKHLEHFVTKFNEAFAGKNPQLHITANHHQNQYDDKTFAKALTDLTGNHKRALILACGPDSKAYRNMPDFDFVIIPRPDGQVLAPELDPHASPAYRYVIGWMKNAQDVQEIKERFDGWDIDHVGSTMRDWLAQKAYYGLSAPYKPPVILGPEELAPQTSGQLPSPKTPASPAVSTDSTPERR